ncbi:F-box/LRR-repeat protein 17-like [Branchiostoma floridae x Branchiostoma japonicum]
MGIFQSKTKDKNTNPQRSRHQKSSSRDENTAPSHKLVVLETSFLNKCPRMDDKGRKYTADLQEDSDVEDNVEELTHYRDHGDSDLRNSDQLQSNTSNAANHSTSPLLTNHLTERPGTSYTSSNGPHFGHRWPSSGPYEVRKEKRRTEPPSPDVIPPSPKYFKRDAPFPQSQQQHPKNTYYRPLCMSYSETEESDTDGFSEVAPLDLTATALKNESGRYQLCYSVPSTSKSTEPTTLSSAESIDACSDPWSVHSSQSSLLSTSSSKRQLSINDLPQTIFLKILSYLGMEERCRHVCRVCKFWHQMCFDSELWRKIDLRGKDKVTDDVLGRVTSYSTNVMYVDVSDCNNVTDQGVIAMAKQCSSLLEFKCTRCNHLTDAAFIALAQGCPGLQKLTVDGVRQITDVAFKEISACCKELWYLNVSQVNNLTDVGVRHVVTGCPKLTYLKFQENNKVADYSVETIAEHCPQMEVLGLMGCSVAPDAVLHLTKCTNLKVLNLCRLRELTDHAVIEIVRHCRKLESINLCLNSGITDTSIEFIAREAKCLKDLHMVACAITDKALTSIGKYSHSLETVDVGHCPSITDAGSAFISQNCRTLRYLGLMRCDAVREETVDELVEKHPQIHFSTLMLDCKRILAQAQQQGWKPAHSR